jgi:hypothetical protein
MEGERINIWWLLLGGAVLLSAGWLMHSFPIFIFIGLAPFFAILDHTVESENFWEHAEMILIGLAVAFFSAFALDTSSIITVLMHTILFTLPFIGFAFVHESLGPRTGKFIVILIWLGLEYLLVKLQWPANTVFLGDSLGAWPNWFRWNRETGYLGVSAWILTSNWLVYTGTMRSGLNWALVFLALAVIAGPLVYSLMIEAKPILREDMIELYATDSVLKGSYAAQGELVARTCAWISVLILIFAGVKSRTAK